GERGRMIPKLEMWLAAKAMIQRYSSNAGMEAAERADELLGKREMGLVAHPGCDRDAAGREVGTWGDGAVRRTAIAATRERTVHSCSDGAAYFAGGCEWRWPIFQPLDVQE